MAREGLMMINILPPKLAVTELTCKGIKKKDDIIYKQRNVKSII